MNPINIARCYDSESRPVEAAWAYEIALTKEDATLEVVFDLVAIYTCANDFGFATAFRLDARFVDYAYYRAIELLDSAAARFGSHPDLGAWRMYLDDLLGIADMDSAELAVLASFPAGVLAKALVGMQRDQYLSRQEVVAVRAWASSVDTQRKRLILGFLGTGSSD